MVGGSSFQFNLLASALGVATVSVVSTTQSRIEDIKSQAPNADDATSNRDAAILILLAISVIILVIGILLSLVLSQLWPVKVHELLRLKRGDPGAILDLAYKCNRCDRDFWSIRYGLFWGERSLILTSEKAVREVLLNANVFERTMPNAANSVTSFHTVLGAPGGSSPKWRRLRTVCCPFFDTAGFEKRTAEAIDHIIAVVKTAIENAPKDGIEYFQLINRLVVEIHLLLLLGVESIPSEGMRVQNPMVERGSANDTVVLADAIDVSLAVDGQGSAPTHTSKQFAPLLNFLSERLQLPAEELGGIESILNEAQKAGEVTTIERLHNLCMFMIALAPSPASFWTTVHVFRDRSLLKDVQGEADAGHFTKLSMCFKETLRMYAPVPVMIQRYAVEDKQCLDQNLKKGDHIVIPTIIIQNDPKLWKDPDSFRPDRWDDGETIETLQNNKVLKLKMRYGSGMESRPGAEKVASKEKARYFPFGMGQHTCLGQPYAVWLTMTIASTIINNFDVELSDPEGIMEESPSYKRIRDHIYSFPKHPLKAKIRSLDADVGAMRSKSFRKSMTSGMDRVSAFVGGTGQGDRRQKGRFRWTAIQRVGEEEEYGHGKGEEGEKDRSGLLGVVEE